MNKDAYYFPHFANARHDRRVKRLRKELGAEGYGIYFMILEVLREQEDFSYPLQDVDLLADDFGTSEQKVDAVIKSYDLFAISEDHFFYSPKFIEYLKPYLDKSKRARNAALKRWHGKSDANADANALPRQCDSNASKGDESKGEEKEHQNRTPSSGSNSTLFKQDKWKEDDSEYKIAKYLLEKILQYKPDHHYSRRTPALQRWADDADKMLRIDSRDKKTIKTVIDWIFLHESKDSDFWKTNIESVKKLRQNFDRLEMQMNQDSKQSGADKTQNLQMYKEFQGYE